VSQNAASADGEADFLRVRGGEEERRRGWMVFRLDEDAAS
tara:strand:- start:5038 stop:5157 length:120 start_codon:yes stop_codon:yes gene_type:complete